MMIALVVFCFLFACVVAGMLFGKYIKEDKDE